MSDRFTSETITTMIIVAVVVALISSAFALVWYTTPHEHRWHGIAEPVHCNSDRNRQWCIGEHHSYTCVVTYDDFVDHWCTEGLAR